jgi:hypothetical protein
MTKALQAGIINEDNNSNFVINAVWYDRIHAADKTTANEIDSLHEFESTFVGIALPFVQTRTYGMSEAEYGTVLTALDKHWRGLKTRRR